MERRRPTPAANLFGNVIDPVQSAKAVGLHYVTDEMPGIRRARSGKAFRYIDAQGKPLRNPDELRRIKSLVIPPAWKDVWICPIPNGHLQATGRDDRARKQYRYHPRWREVRDQGKYNRMIQFGTVLPKIRTQVQRDMSQPGLPQRKVLATVVQLLEVSLIRIGNEEYARQNNSFGLTTLRDQHVEIKGSHLEFHFRGKSGKQHRVTIADPRLARIVKKCQDLPGQELFQFIDGEGQRQTIGSAEVNDYLREVTGEEFTAKDFRTWAGTVLAARALRELDEVDSQATAKKNIVRAIEAVAQMLGNTPSICRKCYVHPAILEAYVEGALLRTLRTRPDQKLKTALTQLKPEEAAVLAMLQKRLRAEKRQSSRSPRNAGPGLNGQFKAGGAGRHRGSHTPPRHTREALPASWR